MSTDAQPAPGTGEITGDYGKWTDAAVRALKDVEQKDVGFHKGPLGYSVTWRGKSIGRINRYRRHKTMTVKIEGHQFWIEPNAVITTWHYNPGAVTATVKEAKTLALKLVADAVNLYPNIQARGA